MSYPSWTDDPVRDAEAYANYMEEVAEENRHICDKCGEPIEDRCDSYYEIEGEIWCEDCIDKCRSWVR